MGHPGRNVNRTLEGPGKREKRAAFLDKSSQKWCTLGGLCRKLVDMERFGQIKKLAEQGDLGKVDLTIRDITPDPAATLDPTLTAANFGNLSEDATPQEEGTDRGQGLGLLGEETGPARPGVFAAERIEKDSCKIRQTGVT